ncbi:MAG: diacylglycerol kinase family protein, partial [Firmicutes bacterium]|nr:diacylglycerol kinase family protein [Bacillota bacterium]
MSAKNRSFISGFFHAVDGIKEALKTVRSMRIHAATAVAVVIFGFLLHISLLEWILCVMLFGLV